MQAMLSALQASNRARKRESEKSPLPTNVSRDNEQSWTNNKPYCHLCKYA